MSERMPPPDPEANLPARAVFDPGLQPERTALSWQRTGLAILVGSLVGIRILVPEIGWLAVLAGSAGAILGLTVFVLSSRRHRIIHRTLLGHRTAAHEAAPEHEREVANQLALLPGATLMAVVASSVVVAGVIALAYVVGHAS